MDFQEFSELHFKIQKILFVLESGFNRIMMMKIAVAVNHCGDRNDDNDNNDTLSIMIIIKSWGGGRRGEEDEDDYCDDGDGDGNDTDDGDGGGNGGDDDHYYDHDPFVQGLAFCFGKVVHERPYYRHFRKTRNYIQIWACRVLPVWCGLYQCGMCLQRILKWYSNLNWWSGAILADILCLVTTVNTCNKVLEI